MTDRLSHTKIQLKELIEWLDTYHLPFSPLLIEGLWNLIPETSITLNRTIMGCSQDLGIPTQFSHWLTGHVCVRVTQSCPILCYPMDYRRPGSSVHGIPQTRILEWGAIAFSRFSPTDGIAGRLSSESSVIGHGWSHSVREFHPLESVLCFLVKLKSMTFARSYPDGMDTGIKNENEESSQFSWQILDSKFTFFAFACNGSLVN